MESPDLALPGAAPGLMWFVIIAAVMLWWAWPWLDRYFSSSQIAAPTGARFVPCSSQAADSLVEQTNSLSEYDQETDDFFTDDAPVLVAAPLGFDPIEEFQIVFSEASGIIGQLLDVAPVSPECAAANAAIHKVAAVLDRMFQSWGDQDELARVCQLRENTSAFNKTFCADRRVGRLARQLLEAAGFHACEGAESAEKGCNLITDQKESALVPGEKVWLFSPEEALSRLRCMTVRLCLQRVAELQKLRGTMRWVQTSNDHIVPKVDDSSLPELLVLFREMRSKMELPAQPSQRERLVEASVRNRLNERRSETGCSIPLLPHDGLTAAARMLAYTARKRVREGGVLRPSRPVDAEVQKLLLRTPLPPGFDAAHLHFSSDELPHIFGLASTRGGNDEGGGGATAEILASESVGFWMAKQRSDVVWPCASVCGVGAALDYTVNRGFVVVLMIGYEGLSPPKEEGALAAANSEMRRRRAAANAAAQAPNGAAALPKGNKFGARVQTLGASSTSGFSNAK